MQEAAAIIANLGFPIGISIFLLVRIEGKMEKLTESINQLTTAIAAIGAAEKK